MTSTSPVHVACGDQERTSNDKKSASTTSDENFEMKNEPEAPIDPVMKRKERILVWKIDLLILPLLILVVMFASMVSRLVTYCGMGLISTRGELIWEMPP